MLRYRLLALVLMRMSLCICYYSLIRASQRVQGLEYLHEEGARVSLSPRSSLKTRFSSSGSLTAKISLNFLFLFVVPNSAQDGPRIDYYNYHHQLGPFQSQI